MPPPQIGATEVYVSDLRADFLDNYVFPALQCNAVYEDRYLMGTALARPCIAKAAVRAATIPATKSPADAGPRHRVRIAG